MSNNYKLVRNLPVLRFFYQGESHTHPVRRVVAVISETSTTYTGYELREGSVVRTQDLPVKSYRKDRIANIGQIDKRRVLRRKTPKKRYGETTLSRSSLQSLVLEGI
jgi:hypothetical protein